MRRTIISFSGRNNGNCSKILNIIKDYFHDKDVCLYDFSSFNISLCGNCNYECFSNRESCPFFSDKEYEINDAIATSEISYFIVPNYCDFPCSNYFIFNERSQCYFQKHEDLRNRYIRTNKKFIVVSNTEKDNFKTAFSYHVENEFPSILYLSAKTYGKKSIDGDITQSREAVRDILDFIKD